MRAPANGIVAHAATSDLLWIDFEVGGRMLIGHLVPETRASGSVRRGDVIGTIAAPNPLNGQYAHTHIQMHLVVGPTVPFGDVHGTRFLSAPNLPDIGGVNQHSCVALGSVQSAPVCLLPAPSLNSPSNEATSDAVRPALSWGSVSGANGYWLMVATSPGALPTDPNAISCTLCVISVLRTVTSYILSSDLAHRTAFYWQVQSFKWSGSITSVVRQGQYSTRRSFTTQAVGQ